MARHETTVADSPSRYRHLMSALFLASVVCVICLTGCGSGGPRPVRTEIQPFTPEEQAAWDEASVAEYRLRAGDKFDVYFEYYDDLDLRGAKVLPDGRVSLPHIDPFTARGLTIGEMDSTLTALYTENYLEPELSVVVKEFGNIVVYIFGEVNRAGYVELSPANANLLAVVAQAGGFTTDAATSELLHVRVTPEGYQYRHLDVSHLEKRDFMAPEFLDMQHYDIIYVPRSAIGDLASFRSKVLTTATSITSLFWDVYAVMNIDKVERLVR